MTTSRKLMNEYSSYELNTMRQYIAEGAYDMFSDTVADDDSFTDEDEIEFGAEEAAEKYQLMSYDEIYEEMIVMFTDEEIQEILNDNIPF